MIFSFSKNPEKGFGQAVEILIFVFLSSAVDYSLILWVFFIACWKIIVRYGSMEVF